MILYGVMSGSSIVELFVAGIIPGVLGGLLMMGRRLRARGATPLPRWRGVPARSVCSRRFAGRVGTPAARHRLGRDFQRSVTATEGAGLAVVAAVVLGGLVYRELTWSGPPAGLGRAGNQTAVVMLLVARPPCLSDYFTEIQLPQQVARAMLDVTDNPLAILALLNVFFLMIGLFLHSAAAIILVVPVVMPLVTAVGIDPVHFGLSRHAEPGHRSTDTAGRERAGHGVFRRQGRHLGGQQGERVVRRRSCWPCSCSSPTFPSIPMSLVNLFYH